MNVAAHKEKKKNEETKTDKGRAGEGKRQVTNFKEAVCCSSAVVQGAARQKICLWDGSYRVTVTLGKANSHFDPTQKGLGTAPPR